MKKLLFGCLLTTIGLNLYSNDSYYTVTITNTTDGNVTAVFDYKTTSNPRNQDKTTITKIIPVEGIARIENVPMNINCEISLTYPNKKGGHITAGTLPGYSKDFRIEKKGNNFYTWEK